MTTGNGNGKIELAMRLKRVLDDSCKCLGCSHVLAKGDAYWQGGIYINLCPVCFENRRMRATTPIDKFRITLHQYDPDSKPGAAPRLMEIAPAMIGVIRSLAPVVDDSGKTIHGECTLIQTFPDGAGNTSSWLVYERLHEIQALIPKLGAPIT